MCASSFVADRYRNRWNDQPWFPATDIPSGPIIISQPSPISREEFDDLKKEVLEMKDLLRRAKEYDERTGQPDCEVEEKMALLRKVAEMVGISLDDVIKPKADSVG